MNVYIGCRKYSSVKAAMERHAVGLLTAQNYNCGCTNTMISDAIETLRRLKAYRSEYTERITMLGSVKNMDWNKIV